MFNLPSIKWFYQPQSDGTVKTNSYTGSLWTDPEMGCMNHPIFNYRVWVKKASEDKVLIKANYSIEIVNIIGKKILESSEAEFPATEQGIINLTNWLEKQSLHYNN